ncbi:GAF and ANTAR domain-containing protein [Frigoribacterium faeni]|uniref:GAF domain-containing protein n=1 Tax=Frigoribacterium faeni TaxID=145483 RepID=A0A7W3PJW1_9MICO|nr:GAF and ANTAR domain-containing protein [Frigoribacterium faeni]MBA8814498.1 GAF domain-containing protein [Frigoribacterium faeni]GEK84297.1 transcriptional regulator [Frigoribacterium faeni]
MSETSREARLVEAFATLADTLVAGYDVIELMQTLLETCHDLLDVTAGGILLADDDGDLEVVASTSEGSALVETLQLDARSGPCWDCFTSGEVVSLIDVSDTPDRWGEFGDVAAAQGFHAIYALPLRLRDTVIGTLNLMRATVGELNPRDVRVAQALADVATIGVLQQRTLRDSDMVRAQLQTALSTRVVIEQAKGVVAHTHDVSTDDAFDLIRVHARSKQLKLADVARGLVDRTIRL